MLNVELNYNMVLVKPHETKKETESGIIIPEEARERPSKGIAMEVGEGSIERPMKIIKGATVFHVKQAGHEIEDEDGNIYYIMPDKDILMWIKN